MTAITLLSVIIFIIIACIGSTIATQSDAKRYLKKHGNLDDFWWIKNK